MAVGIILKCYHNQNPQLPFRNESIQPYDMLRVLKPKIMHMVPKLCLACAAVISVLIVRNFMLYAYQLSFAVCRVYCQIK